MSSLRLTAAALVLATSAATLSAQAPAAKHPAAHTAAATRLPTIAYQKYVLPNGLTVLTHEDHRLPLVAVDLWYHVGPLNERPGRTGFAHLFEHMMFEGSEHVGEKSHIKDVEAAGATDVNGTTDFDRTNYFETLPSNQLELGLWLESDRMGFLMEGLNRTLLANQRDVVRNERRQGEGTPYSLAEEAMFRQLFPKDHPYYADVIGSHADVEAARIADVRDFHQQFYTPNNASIAIAGDFNPVKLRALLTKYFGPIPKGPAVPAVHVVTPAITSQKRETITDTVKLSQVKIGWLTPAIFTPDSYAINVAIYALADAKVSRLKKALIYDKPMAQSVRCEVNPLKLTTIVACSITAKPGIKLEDVEATAWSVLNTFSATGPTTDEVAAAKATELSSKIKGLQRLGGFGGIADTLDTYNQYLGDPGYLPKDIAATDAVTAAAAKSAAAKYLTKNAAVVIYTIPGTKVVNDVPRSPETTDAEVKITNPYTDKFEAEQSWRKSMPARGADLKLNLPVPDTFKLPNGLTVMVVQNHALPILTASIATRAGAEHNPHGQSGLANLTSAVLSEATTTRNVEQLASAEELIGTRITSGSTVDAANLNMTVLSSHTNEALALFADITRNPAFSEADFDRLKKQTLVGIDQSSDNVAVLGQRVGPRFIYGDTAYGMPANGTTESVKAFKREDLANFYKAHYAPSDSALILVGDITLAQAHTVAAKYFGDWSGTASAAPKLPQPKEIKSTYLAIIDKPGAPQTALFVFAPGVPANSPDFAQQQVMNYILGGSFASRINMNLREEHGYTYGASTNFRSFREGGLFLGGGLIRTDATAPATREMVGEITRFPTALVTPAELKAAKDGVIQSLPGDFANTEVVASALRGIFIYDRPLDYYAALPAKTEAVTAEDVQRVAKNTLHPDHMVIVTAGDRKQIEDPLKALNLGKVEVFDKEGKKE